MKIYGKKLSQIILRDLKKEVIQLKKKKIAPTLAVIQIGDDIPSKIYIDQKIKFAEKIGITVIAHKLSRRVTFEKVINLVRLLKLDPKVKGIIIQRPIPPHLSSISLSRLIGEKKDVDGFLDKSPYDPPVALAVFFVLQKIFGKKKFLSFVRQKKVLLIGRGETAGKPICKLLQKNKIRFINAHSETNNIEDFERESDIIISCVGKKGVLRGVNLKKGAVVIGLGISRRNNRLYGDYDEREIAKKAAFYTGTPGGVGPLTVAFLMKNVILASKN